MPALKKNLPRSQKIQPWEGKLFVQYKRFSRYAFKTLGRVGSNPHGTRPPHRLMVPRKIRKKLPPPIDEKDWDGHRADP
jgi:hypothetical protein